MNNFSISQLAQFSGVKAHTIRIWEQRYNALTPYRSEGNTRYYDDQQLRRLLNIVTLSTAGYRISDLCVMKDEHLFKLMRSESDKQTSEAYDYYITQLVSAALSFDEVSFEKVFSHCLLRFTITGTYKQIIYPVLQRIGILWSANTIPPAKEHFISNLFRQKIFTAIDALSASSNTKQTWVCFLPEDEFHEIGLLFASYLIRSAGHKVIYLGSNVPQRSLADAVKETRATHLITFFVNNYTKQQQQEYLGSLKYTFPQKKIFIAANQSVVADLKVPGNIQIISSIEELEQNMDV